MRANKVVIHANDRVIWNCSKCGQQVGGYRIYMFMNGCNRFNFCPTCGEKQSYEDEEVAHEKVED